MTAPRAREQADPPSPPDRRPPRRGGSPSSKTVSAAARPAGLARLAGARRGLVRSARALAAAALLALCGGLALPATAQAEVLVSNIGERSHLRASVLAAITLRQRAGFHDLENAAGYVQSWVPASRSKYHTPPLREAGTATWIASGDRARCSYTLIRALASRGTAITPSRTAPAMDHRFRSTQRTISWSWRVTRTPTP